MGWHFFYPFSDQWAWLWWGQRMHKNLHRMRMRMWAEWDLLADAGLCAVDFAKWSDFQKFGISKLNCEKKISSCAVTSQLHNPSSGIKAQTLIGCSYQIFVQQISFPILHCSLIVYSLYNLFSFSALFISHYVKPGDHPVENSSVHLNEWELPLSIIARLRKSCIGY